MKKLTIKAMFCCLFVFTIISFFNISRSWGDDNTFRVKEILPYASHYPYSVLFCSLTTYNPKNKNEVAGAKAGHAIFYLKGAQVEKRHFPPRFGLIPPSELKKNPYQGIGVSINRHLKNSNWLTFDRPDIFFFGGVGANEKFTYEKRKELELNLISDLSFYKTDLSGESNIQKVQNLARNVIGTDVGILLARNAACQNIPMSPELFHLFLNVLNTINEDESKNGYNFSYITNNCTFPIHNALALTTGSLHYKEPKQFFPFFLFNLVVPANSIYKLHKHFHLKLYADPEDYYDNENYRHVFLKYSWTVLEHGTFIQYFNIHPDELNEVYWSPHEALSFPEYHFPFGFENRFNTLIEDSKSLDYQYNREHYDVYEKYYEKMLEKIAGKKSKKRYQKNKNFRSFLDKFESYIKDKKREVQEIKEELEVIQ